MNSLFHPNPGASEVFQGVAFLFSAKNKTKHVSASCFRFFYPQYLAASTFLVQTRENSQKETLSVVKVFDGQVVLPL